MARNCPGVVNKVGKQVTWLWEGAKHGMPMYCGVKFGFGACFNTSKVIGKRFKTPGWPKQPAASPGLFCARTELVMNFYNPGISMETCYYNILWLKKVFWGAA